MILKGPFLILDTIRWGGLESFVRQIKPRFNLLFVYFWKAFSWVSFIFLVFVKGTWVGLVVMSVRLLMVFCRCWNEFFGLFLCNLIIK